MEAQRAGLDMNLLSLQDLSDEDLEWIVSRGAALARDDERHRRSLEGLVVGVFFTKSSTRTRTAFSAAALRLGADLVTFGPDDLQLVTGESLEDTGLVLARMVDAQKHKKYYNVTLLRYTTTL